MCTLGREQERRFKADAATERYALTRGKRIQDGHIRPSTCDDSNLKPIYIQPEDVQNQWSLPYVLDDPACFESDAGGGQRESRVNLT
jgi:hypothetical protein